MQYNIADIDLICDQCNCKLNESCPTSYYIKYWCNIHNININFFKITDRSEILLTYYIIDYNYNEVNYRLYGSINSRDTILWIGESNFSHIRFHKFLFPDKINNEGFYKIFLRLLKVSNIS